MTRLISLMGALAALMVAVGGGAAADSTTYTLRCGTERYAVIKENESAAVYTNGAMNFVTAIGAIIGSSPAQNAVFCTINGSGPVPFIITPSH